MYLIYGSGSRGGHGLFLNLAGTKQLQVCGELVSVVFVCRALGITLWELFESAAQPYPHLSDREVLNHVIKDQQIKLFKPHLELPYSERW